jgi:hypothetical protein
VAAYLLETGLYQVSRRTIYNHVDNKFLQPGKDGFFTLAAVRKYAEAHLPLKASPGGDVGEMNQALIAAKTERERVQTQRTEFLLQKDRKKYVHVADHTMALAGRWKIIRDGLDSLASAAAADLVDIVGGDQARIGDAMAYLQREFREFLAQFAKGRDFEVKMTEEDILEFLARFRGQAFQEPDLEAVEPDDVPAD